MRFVLAILISIAGSLAALGAERRALVIAQPQLSMTAGTSGARIADSFERAGFLVTRVVDGDRAAAARSVYDFVVALSEDPQAVGVVYYAGPAVQADGASYLMTAGASAGSANELAETALPLATVLGALDAVPAYKLVMVDVSGAVSPGRGIEPGLAELPAMATTGIVYSTQPGSVALDGNGPSSVFAEVAANALTIPDVDVELLLGKIRDDVADMTGGRQVPWISASSAGGVRLVTGLETEASAAPAPSEPAPTEPQPLPPAPMEPAPPPPPPAPGDYGYLPGGEDEKPWPFDHDPYLGSGETSASMEDAGVYAEMRRQEEMRLEQERQRQAAYEEALRRYREMAAAKDTQGQNNLGETYLDKGGYRDMAAFSEAEAWTMVAGGSDPDAYAAYLMLHPNGQHADEAKAWLKTLEPGGQPATVDVTRYPTIDAPDTVAAGETVTVSVALTGEKFTPEVKAKPAPGTDMTTDGAFMLPMPAERQDWPIDIDLFATGFDLVDKDAGWSRRVTLYRDLDSDFARFEIKARPIAGDSKPGQFMVRFYSEGRFLGSATRAVSIDRQPAASPEASGDMAGRTAPFSLAGPPPVLSGPISVAAGGDVPDLDITVLYDDPSGLGEAQIVIHSPHLPGPVADRFSTPPAMAAWLDGEYRRLLDLGLKVRGAAPLQPGAAPAGPEADRRLATVAAEGFGDALYRDYAPAAFKQLYWRLRDRGVLKSIQVTSNSPTLPWELIRPQSDDGSRRDDFLGLSYRLARWAPRNLASQIDNPLNAMAFTGVAAVVPAYADARALPFQQVEVDALSKLAGFRRFDGDFISFEKLIGETSAGFIHFSGHGALNEPGSGQPVFAIELANRQLLDPNTWSALTAGLATRGSPFYFFNACDTGRSAVLGGFVQGWGPAVLNSGASGFIGGMWPLSDRTAAAFSARFYGDMSEGLRAGPVYLADVLRGVRGLFRETGDPTYLAYTFYGNANLRIVAQ